MRCSLLGLIAWMTGFAGTGLRVSVAGPALPPAPAGEPTPPREFDRWRDGIGHGRLVAEECASRGWNGRRPMMIYYPPGYLPSIRYPVLYLLHGMADDESAWTRKGALEPILDNLYAAGRVVPMVVIMPNVRASSEIPLDASWETQAAAFAGFGTELLKSIVPFVESRIPVLSDREHRAIVGVARGAGQALSVAFEHPDQFGWVGVLSPAGIRGTELPKLTGSGLAGPPFRLLTLRTSETDPLIDLARGLHDSLDRQRIQHEWQLGHGGHTWSVWKRDLYYVSQVLFR